MLMQALAQHACPLAHPAAVVHTQAPFEHVWPAAHWCAQAPQLFGSVWVLVQTPAHRVGVAPAQPHTPPVHAAPAAHLVPQPPQLFGSLLVFIQLPPHRAVPLPHVGHPGTGTHVPFMHTGVAVEHCFPQPPQLVGSLLVFRQALPHSVVPRPQVGQVTGVTQWPLEQVWPAGQHPVVPQTPVLVPLGPQS
jgi:hypothetical protein